MDSHSPTTLLRYRIAPHDRNAHLLRVDLIFSTIQHCVEIDWATWIPGSYLIREFARHVVRLEATRNQDSTTLQIAKITKSRWKIQYCAAGIASDIGSAMPTETVNPSAGDASRNALDTSLATWKISATIYAFDASVRGAMLSAQRFYFNGAAVFPALVDYHGGIELDIEYEHTRTSHTVATTLPALACDDRGFGRYLAKDYATLIDHPVEISQFETIKFEVAGVAHRLVVTGAFRADVARIGVDMAKVCAQHCQLFHGATSPPFSQYLFLLNVLPEGYGGLEHADSTSMVCALRDLPIVGDPSISEGYLQLLSLMSHEYFHAWNVKRIKPQQFQPYDLSKEALTSQLWLYEGFTSYYDELALLRAGCITTEDYLRLLGRNLTALARNPGKNVQSLSQASEDAWIKYYRADENTPNAQVSYYLKGGLVALLLDLTLRHAHHCSLDDLMRLLWQEAQSPDYAGTTDAGIAQHLAELTGISWLEWLKHYIYGTAPLPLEAALGHFGIQLHWRSAQSGHDRGGSAETLNFPNIHPLQLGLQLLEGQEITVRTVYAGSAAEHAGLCAQDTLIAINDIKITSKNLHDVLMRFRPNDRMHCHFFRDHHLLQTSLIVPKVKADTAYCTIEHDATEAQLTLRTKWLGALH